MSVVGASGCVLTLSTVWFVVLSGLAPTFLQCVGHAQALTAFVAAKCVFSPHNAHRHVVLALFPAMMSVWVAGSMLENHRCQPTLGRENSTLLLVDIPSIASCRFISSSLWYTSWITATTESTLLLWCTTLCVNDLVMRGHAISYNPAMGLILVLLALCTVYPLLNTLHVGFSPSYLSLIGFSYALGIHHAHPRDGRLQGFGILALLWTVLTQRQCTEWAFVRNADYLSCKRAWWLQRAVIQVLFAVFLAHCVYINTGAEALKWTLRLSSPWKNINPPSRLKIKWTRSSKSNIS
jgi:hypothetical protein